MPPMIDPELSLAFALHENPKAFALLLGSGLSRSAMIPTGWEITLDLVRKVGRLRDAPEQADWGAWHQQTFGKPANYSELLDQLSNGPDERRAILHRYIEASPEDRAEGRKTPTPAHRAIARLVADGFVRVIITTNFDRLLEEALRELGIQPTIIASDDALAGATPLIHCTCCIIKVHGDYLDTRIRNTESELAAYSAALDMLLDRILDEHGLLVCGWSGDWDPALRAAIMRTPSRRYPLYWVSRGEPTALAGDLIAARHGRLVKVDDADGFFSRLAERIALQRELSQPDPRSVALLVSALKKYVAVPEHRVQLHDLLAREVRRLDDVLPAPNTTMDLLSDESFAAWVRRVEAALEPLARVFCVLGRWGGEDEADVALSLIRSRLRLPGLSGLTRLIALREYPAMLCAYALGLGALAGGRLDLAHRVYSLPVAQNGRPSEPFVRAHFLDRWDGAQNPWNVLADPKPADAPFSAHLLRLFSAWAADITLSPSDFDLLFARFELLGSLEYILQDHGVEALRLPAQTGDRHPRVWTPLGRSRFENDQVERILEEWTSASGLTALLRGGLGDEEIVTLAVAHLQDQIARRRVFG